MTDSYLGIVFLGVVGILNAVVIVGLGLTYAWKKGALEWE